MHLPSPSIYNNVHYFFFFSQRQKGFRNNKKRQFITSRPNLHISFARASASFASIW